ncbi:hypothetical protein F5I97DRAFT_1867122 [Phlebopus sp. FC_14]|nr:hypothetical protein F5I97DRAFT_1867122 [Phlebopus sp. FC_14]
MRLTESATHLLHCFWSLSHCLKTHCVHKSPGKDCRPCPRSSGTAHHRTGRQQLCAICEPRLQLAILTFSFRQKVGCR